MALTILLYVIWPGRQGLRYLFPLLPFYVSFLFTGLAVSYRSSAIFGKRINPSYLIAAVVMTLLFFAEETSYRASKNVFNDRPLSEAPFAPEAREMFHFIRDNTDIGDTIVFFKPRVMRLMTDRMSISFGTWSNGSCEDTGTGDYLVVYKCEKKA